MKYVIEYAILAIILSPLLFIIWEFIWYKIRRNKKTGRNIDLDLIYKLDGYSKARTPRSFGKYFDVINGLLLSLYSAMAIKYISVLREKINKDNTLEEFDVTIVGMVLLSKIKQHTISYLFILLAISFYFLFAYIIDYEINSAMLIFFALFASLINLNLIIIKYRISRGYYGKNEHEARELILYILNHSDKSDFSDGDGLKKLFVIPEQNAHKTDTLGGSLGWIE